MNYLIVFITGILGGSIQGSTGFGFAILAMAVLPFFIPFKVASSVVLIMSITMNAQVLMKLRKYINYRMIIPTTIGAFVGRSIGVYGLMNLNVDILKTILGIVLVVLSGYFYKFNNKIRMKASARNGTIMGLFSGLLGGLFSIGGPPLVIYYFSAIENKMEYSAAIQATFILSNMYTLLLHFFYGNINLTVIKYAGVGFIAITAGCYIGLYIFEKLNRDALSKAIYAFMALMGAMLIIKI